jgi:SAM-dependent methyltransferase
VENDTLSELNVKVAEYDAFATYYDLIYSGKDDLPFYVELARQTGGPVLELACGTGRLTVEIAAAGFETVGLEAAPQMLKHAHNKLANASQGAQTRCRLQSGDMRNFSIGRQFGLVVLAFSSLLELNSREDRLSTLRCCCNHLAPDGAIVIDNFFYGEGEHKDWGKRRPDHVMLHIGSYPDPVNAGSTIHHIDSDIFDRQQMRTIRTMFMKHTSPGGLVQQEAIVVVNRCYVPPEMMEQELRDAGLTQIEIYGGFGKEPLYDPRLKGKGRQIFVART